MGARRERFDGAALEILTMSESQIAGAPERGEPERDRGRRDPGPAELPQPPARLRGSVHVAVIPLLCAQRRFQIKRDDAPQRYKDFDSGVAKKFVFDPHGPIEA